MNGSGRDSYHLERFNAFPLVNFFQYAGEISAQLKGGDPDAGWGRLSDFLVMAGSLYPAVQETEDYEIIQNFLASPASTESPDQQTLEENRAGIPNCVSGVCEAIRDHLSQKNLLLQETYPSFENSRLLVDYFSDRDRAVLPQSVCEDWAESAQSLEYGLFRAGSIMALRAAEGMLKYFCWNATGIKPEGVFEKIPGLVNSEIIEPIQTKTIVTRKNKSGNKRSIRPLNKKSIKAESVQIIKKKSVKVKSVRATKNKPGKGRSIRTNHNKFAKARGIGTTKSKSDEWGWQQTINFLQKDQQIDLPFSTELDRARTARNLLAHGAIEYSVVEPRTAKRNIDTAFQVINAIVSELATQKKALRVCANINTTFDTCLAYWLFDRYGGGVANLECRPEDKSAKQWYSYELSLGGKYSPKSGQSCAQAVYDDLVRWNCIPQRDKYFVASLITKANNQPDDKDVADDDRSIYRIVKQIKRCLSKDQVAQYKKIKELINKIFNRAISLEDDNNFDSLWREVVLPLQNSDQRPG